MTRLLAKALEGPNILESNPPDSTTCQLVVLLCPVHIWMLQLLFVSIRSWCASNSCHIFVKFLFCYPHRYYLLLHYINKLCLSIFLKNLFIKIPNYHYPSMICFCNFVKLILVSSLFHFTSVKFLFCYPHCYYLLLYYINKLCSSIFS